MFELLQFFWFVSVSCSSGLASWNWLSFVIASLSVFELFHHIASLLQTAFVLKRFPDAGDDGAVSKWSFRNLTPVIHNRQLSFLVSSFLNYPLWRIALTVLNSGFLCFLCEHERCARFEGGLFVSEAGHNIFVSPFHVTCTCWIILCGESEITLLCRFVGPRRSGACWRPFLSTEPLLHVHTHVRHI